MKTESPSTIAAAADALRSSNESGAKVRFFGGGTKSSWGNPVDGIDVELTTGGLTRIVEHNAGDLTAVVEAGLPLADLHAEVGEKGQMLALDPLDPGGATVGGTVATGDSGPLRHRYGPVRDLVLGVTVVLPDGTVAKSGGKVIKNVAGYDLGKLFASSMGTLGLIARIAVRLHPKPPRTVTLVASTASPDALQAAAIAVSALPLEAESLDVSWSAGVGALLARFAGAAPDGRAAAAREGLAGIDVDVEITDDDTALWLEQARAQRSEAGAALKISGLPTETAKIVSAVESAGGRAVGRAALGLFWATMEGAPGDLVAQIEEVRSGVKPWPVTVTDAPDDVRRKVDVWGEPNAWTLMHRMKQRFDPNGICNPGIYVGGL
jgi:glycolate oxidase FAD binding subunit